MAWVLSKMLPWEIVAIVDRMAHEREPLCHCVDCGALLLAQDTEPVVRTGDRFTYCMAYGALEVAVNQARRARLLVSRQTVPRQTLFLPTHRVDEDHVLDCAFTPRYFKCDGAVFVNERPRMWMYAPFTRLDGRCVCMKCMGPRKGVREGFKEWKALARS